LSSGYTTLLLFALWIKKKQASSIMSVTGIVSEDDNDSEIAQPNMSTTTVSTSSKVATTTTAEVVGTDTNVASASDGSMMVPVGIDSGCTTGSTAASNNINTDTTTNSASNIAVVSTKYGKGYILHHRLEDEIMEIQLQHGARLYAPSHSINTAATNATTIHTSCDALDVSLQSCTNDDLHNDQSVMELNVAYESLETMRKLNLEMTCQENHIPYTPQDLQTTCAVCLLSREPYRMSPPPTATDTVATATPQKRSFFTKNTSSTNSNDVSTAYNKMLVKKYSKAKVSLPCLICGTPTCPKHGSASFRKENIIMCLNCEELFGLSYVVQILTCPEPKLRRQYIDKMIELYDRTILLLRFITTVQFDHICTVLQQSTIRKNKVGIGSSSAGIVSGVLGIVSAATIFTPIGPPLLIASLVFGGSATAAQTGSHLRNSSVCSEQHRIADRVIALHGICWNILRVTGTLRDALLLDHLRTDLYTVDDNGHGVQHIMLTGTSQISTSPISDYYREHQNEVLAKASNLGSIGTMGMVGFTAASMEIGGAVTAVESGAVAARGATFFSRGGTAAAALNALQFARFAGGTLAAATLVFEAHNLKNTIRAIQSGNPCEKVETIKRIRDQIRDIPSTQAVDAECERYLQALTRRQRVLTEQEVTNLLMETNEIIQEVQEIAAQESNHAENDANDDEKNDALAASERSRESIHRRLTMFQRSQSTSSSIQDEHDTASTTTSRPILSLRERIQMQKRQEQRSNSPSTIRECNNECEDDAKHAENLIC
jgi:hypothetical protein